MEKTIEMVMREQLALHPTWYTTVRHLAEFATSKLDLSDSEAPWYVMDIAASLLPEGTPEGEMETDLCTDEEKEYNRREHECIPFRPRRPGRAK